MENFTFLSLFFFIFFGLILYVGLAHGFKIVFGILIGNLIGLTLVAGIFFISHAIHGTDDVVSEKSEIIKLEETDKIFSLVDQANEIMKRSEK